MKSFILSGMLVFLAHQSISAVAGDVSNESLAEAWGVEDPNEIAEIEKSTSNHHHHHHRHHHHE